MQHHSARLLHTTVVSYRILMLVLLLSAAGCYHAKAASARVIPDEQRLLNKVFKNYDQSVRPVFNATKNVVVSFGLTLIQIMDMVSASFIIIVLNVFYQIMEGQRVRVALFCCGNYISKTWQNFVGLFCSNDSGNR